MFIVVYPWPIDMLEGIVDDTVRILSNVGEVRFADVVVVVVIVNEVVLLVAIIALALLPVLLLLL